MATTREEDLLIEGVERSMSAISLVGTLFILVTFTVFPTFRKPINRLVVYASVGNVLCNIATLVSVSALPNHGGSIALCRFQGFFIQMFMPADSLWTLCMAMNVYLTFFHNYNAIDLRNLEIRYAAICYGLPFIPALVYLILDATTTKHIYGNAVLWCWVSSEWEWMRIAFFYGPVWLVIILTIIIYVITGKVIFRQRAALRAFSRSTTEPMTTLVEKSVGGVTRVTEIEVTTEVVQPGAHLAASVDADTRSSFSSTRNLSSTSKNASSAETVNTTVNPFDCYDQSSSVWPYGTSSAGEPDPNNMCSTNVSAGRAVPADMMKELERRPAARKPVKSSRQQDAAWGYAKVAFLMFIALFIVWVPSTVNRVYSLVHPDESNFALSLVAAAVLPLQGFWNFCIYILTSWHQARDVWRRMTKEVRRFFRRQLRRSNSTATPARPGARGIRLDSVATTATPAGVASAGTHGSATSAAAGERQGVHQRSGSLSSNSTLQDVDISSMSKQVRLESSKDSMRTPGAMSAASGRR